MDEDEGLLATVQKFAKSYNIGYRSGIKYTSDIWKRIFYLIDSTSMNRSKVQNEIDAHCTVLSALVSYRKEKSSYHIGFRDGSEAMNGLWERFLEAKNAKDWREQDVLRCEIADLENVTALTIRPYDHG